MISEAFSRFGSSDYRKGTDKTKLHSYAVVYDPLLAPYKSVATSVLEIGLETGSSLAALQDYFQNATIHGIDLVDRVYPDFKRLDRVSLCFGDALAPSTIHHFTATYDVIIEDASHVPAHQKQHFADYCGFIRTGGVYVIEDVHNNHKQEILSFVKSIGEPLNFTCTLHDLTGYKNIPDDNLIVCKRS
jgi:hypothetical protein